MKRNTLLRERGQGLVEFAVVFPIFVFLIFVVIDGGLLMGRYNEINHAAKEGARVGATGALDDDIKDRAKAQALDLLGNTPGGCGAGAPAVCAEWADGPNGEDAGQVGSTVKVTVRYNYGLITPLANQIAGGFDVSSCAVMRLERPVPDPPRIAGSGSC